MVHSSCHRPQKRSDYQHDAGKDTRIRPDDPKWVQWSGKRVALRLLERGGNHREQRQLVDQ